MSKRKWLAIILAGIAGLIILALALGAITAAVVGDIAPDGKIKKTTKPSSRPTVTAPATTSPPRTTAPVPTTPAPRTTAPATTEPPVIGFKSVPKTKASTPR